MPTTIPSCSDAPPSTSHAKGDSPPCTPSSSSTADVQALYVVPGSVALGEPPESYVTRAAALGCTLSGPTSTTPVTVFPSAVVVSTVLTPVVFPDTAGQATAAEVSTAAAKATTAETKRAGNTETIRTKLQEAIAANKTWVTTTADKFTYTLTKAEQRALIGQVKKLSHQCNRLIRIVLDLLTTATASTT